MKIISPFGPKLGKIKIPKKIISLLNQEVDKIIKNKKETKQKDYSKKVVGQVYQEIQISKKFIDKNLKKVIQKNVSGSKREPGSKRDPKTWGLGSKSRPKIRA